MSIQRNILLAAVFVFASCAGVGRPPMAPADPAYTSLRHELVEALRERNRKIQTLKSLATFRYGSKLLGRTGQTALVVQKPYRLRLDGISEFGANDAQMVLSRADMTIYWASDNRYFQGVASIDRLERYLLVSLQPESAIELLAGGLPLEDEADYRLTTRKKGEEMVLRGRSGEVVLIRKDSAYVPIEYTAFDIDDSKLYRVAFDGYALQDGIWFPGGLRARFWNPKSRLELTYHGVEINPSVDGAVFQLNIPDDATRIYD